jgi:hypothetical protein
MASGGALGTVEGDGRARRSETVRWRWLLAHGRGPGSLAGGVDNQDLGPHDDTDLHHDEQDGHDEGQGHGELDRGLAPFAVSPMSTAG